MKLIQLTRGYVALVDDEDYDRIRRFNWFASVGAQIRAARMQNRQMIYMHHQVLDIMPWRLDGMEIDHIDGNPLNNSRSNLRVVSHTDNMRNTKRHKERVGVCFDKRSWSWLAYLDEPGQKRKYLGYRKSKEEALRLVEEARNAHSSN